MIGNHLTRTNVADVDNEANAESQWLPLKHADDIKAVGSHITKAFKRAFIG